MARYVKQTWTDGSGGATPVSAARLAVMETGIFAVDYKDAVRVYYDSGQSIANTTLTALAFNQERFDTASNAASTMHDPVTNNSRLTCRVAGIYDILGCAAWAANATGYRRLDIRLNGATTISLAQQLSTGAGQVTTMNIAALYQLSVNDYVELMAYQNSGGALDVSSVANYSPEFSMVRVA